MPIGRTLWDRRVVMRDGVELAADVVLPDGDGPWPAIVNRTPYMRGRNLRPGSWMRLVEDGYAVVAVDVRGRGDSDGRFVPFVHDADDGHDTIEWVAAQSWCTGRVGGVGGSYEGLTAWWSAKGRPPHLRCIVPRAVGVARLGPRPERDTGVPHQYWLWWFHMVSGRTSQNTSAPSWEANWDHLPLRDLHERIGTSREWWPMYVNGTLDALGPAWALTAEDWERLDIPALICVGWWDDQTAMDTWLALRGSPAGERSHLLVGAWDHAGNVRPRPVLGGLDVSASVIDSTRYIERFLALHLKGDAGAAADLARCRVFRTGSGRWESLDEWPARHSAETAWHLDARHGLSRAIPREDGADGYDYDPRNPGRDFSNLDVLAWSDPPLDATYRLRRDDVLVFSTDELKRPIDVSGRARLECFVSSDRPDTDLVVRLYDVHPDGRSIALGHAGMLRLAYRDGPSAVPLTPGVPALVRIPITWLHHCFDRGHRVRLSIASSDRPNNALNLNRGEPWADAVRSYVARVTIHRGPSHPSRLLLPVEGSDVP